MLLIDQMLTDQTILKVIDSSHFGTYAAIFTLKPNHQTYIIRRAHEDFKRFML